jgi:hypothetical protein
VNIISLNLIYLESIISPNLQMRKSGFRNSFLSFSGGQVLSRCVSGYIVWRNHLQGSEFPGLVWSLGFFISSFSQLLLLPCVGHTLNIKALSHYTISERRIHNKCVIMWVCECVFIKLIYKKCNWRYKHFKKPLRFR